MAFGDFYNTGTVAMVNGSTTVNGTGVDFSDIVPGDRLEVAGLQVSIAAKVDADTLTLFLPWPGASNPTASYVIWKDSKKRYNPALTQEVLREFLIMLKELGIIYHTVGTPDNAIGEDGQYALDTTAALWKLWLKVSGAWVLQATPVGASTPASETASGYVEFATAAETRAGTSSALAVHPAGLLAATVLKTLTADITMFVRPDATGDSGRDGSADTAASAFLTWNAAKEFARNTYNFNNKRVTVKSGSAGLGTGTKVFTGTSIIAVANWMGGGIFRFEGVTTNPQEVRLVATSDHCVRVDGPLSGLVQVDGFELRSTGGAGLYHAGIGSVIMGNLYFGECVGRFIETNGNQFAHLEDTSGKTITFDADMASGSGFFIDNSNILLVGNLHIFKNRTIQKLCELRFRSFLHINSITTNGTLSELQPTIVAAMNGSHIRLTDSTLIPPGWSFAIEPGSSFSHGTVAKNAPAERVRATATNDAAPSGFVGQYISSTTSSDVTISANVLTDITWFSLPSGNWICGGQLDYISPDGTTVWLRRRTAVNTNSASFSGPFINPIGQEHYSSPGVQNGANEYHSLPAIPRMVTMASPGTLYLIAQANYTGGTPKVRGTLYAWRPR